MEPISAAKAAADLTDVADRLGILQAVKRRLISQPDPAAEKLETVLDEIQKIYNALEGEILRYLGLLLDKESDRYQQDLETLRELESGTLTVRMRKAKTACYKIDSVYDRYLRGWFSRVIAPGETELLRNLFRDLGDIDGQAILAIDEVANWLVGKAKATLTLVDADQLEEAQRLLSTARQEIHPTRQSMNRAVGTLLDLQADFVKASRTL